MATLLNFHPIINLFTAAEVVILKSTILSDLVTDGTITALLFRSTYSCLDQHIPA